MRVNVYDDEGKMLAELNITRVDSTLTDKVIGEYQIRYAVERDTDMVGLHQRGLTGFNRLRYNALGFLRAALNLLTESELELEYGADSPDVANQRRLSRLSITDGMNSEL